jgi:pyrroloquinoline quinone biosynthesis protein D
LSAHRPDRGRRVGSKNEGHAPITRVVRLHLAPGVRIDRGEEKPEALVLVSPGGSVQLNEVALDILRLCDGSRTRDDIVAQVVPQPRGTTLAADVGEFLDVAQARGWIIEA